MDQFNEIRAGVLGVGIAVETRPATANVPDLAGQRRKTSPCGRRFGCALSRLSCSPPIPNVGAETGPRGGL